MRKITTMTLVVVLMVSACSSAAEMAVEQLAESDDGVSNVEINDGEITVEFDDEEGGGSLVVGGGDVPDGFPIPVPDGGTVTSSISQDNSYGLAMTFTGAAYDELVRFYEGWIASQGIEGAVHNEFDSPKSNSWSGVMGDATFSILVGEDPAPGDSQGVMLMLNWEG